MLKKIATINLALAFAHQADAAYWHEWEMFGLPGGIQLFSLLNVFLFSGLLFLLSNVVQDRPSAFKSSIVIAALSGLILPIHAGFALAGFGQFNLPFSVALIGGTFALSVAQVILTLRQRRQTGDA